MNVLENLMDENKNYSNFKIGRYTYGNPKIESWKINCGKLEIGNFCSIAGGVRIFLGGDHHTEWVTTSPVGHYFGTNAYPQVRTDGDVIIGNDVWIGVDALILSGVTIGDGAVIGARAVVSHNVSPYSIAVGNPAKIVKKRFSDEQIEKLLEIKWWNWDDKKIKENIPLILNSDIDGFISKFYGEI